MRHIVVAAVALVCLPSAAASAHEWYSGLTEPNSFRSCCGEYDCAPVAMCATSDGKEGIAPGGVCRSIPWDKVLGVASPDGEAHACVVLGEIRCVILPGEV